MRTVAKIKFIIDKLYTKHLLATNVVTCGALLGLGDIVVQGIGHIRGYSETKTLDWARTGRMVTVGFILGPFNHYWYQFLDKAVKRQGLQGVFQKIVCDQFVAGPFFCSSFLIGSTILEGGGVKGAVQEWKNKFLSIYMIDWAFWPAAQFINFRFVPTRFRVLYVSLATLIWNSILSFMKHDHKVVEKSGNLSKAKVKPQKIG